MNLDVEAALFPPSDPAEPGGGDREGMSGIADLFRAVNWKGNAKLDALDEDHDGVKCAAIALEFEGSGGLEDPESSGYGGRRERMPESGVDAGAAFGTTIQIRLKGRLLFALEERHPLSSEIEGHVDIDSDSERTYGGSTMRIRLSREGRFKHEVELTKAE